MPIVSIGDLVKESKRYEDCLLGVETEDKEEDFEDSPYAPSDIRISQRMISIYQVHHWIENGTLLLSPDFQRNMVWDIQRQSLLIESLMLGIPIAAFYFQEDYEGNKLVIDGLQRLSTINLYMRDEFQLKGLQYLKNYNGSRYSQLPKKYRLRIEETQLAVNILDSTCNELVKFDVFRRVNTGGVPLNSQEIRNIMATAETRSLLNEMSRSEEFIEATRGKVKDIRMDAQELCLRFIAFYTRYDFTTGSFNSMNALSKMLDQTILDLNKIKKGQHELFLDAFKKSMGRCRRLLGDTAFSKESVNYIINKPLFTSWSVVMANFEISSELLIKNCQKAKALQHEYFDIGQYYNAITSSTATMKNIELQFKGVRRILEELFDVDSVEADKF